jgi:sodium-coupled neutral amino acid transporter 11
LLEDDDAADTGGVPRRLSKKIASALRNTYSNHGRWHPEQDSHEQASFLVLVFNMFVDLVPPGMLPLAYGVAQGTGLISAFIITFAFAFLSIFTMTCIARCVHHSGYGTYGSIWKQVIGERTMAVPVIVVILVCFGTLLSYACFYARLLSSAAPALGAPAFVDRTFVLLSVGLVLLLPLCLLRDLSALQYSSGFGVVATLYCIGLLVCRALDGTYAPGGIYYEMLDANLLPTPSTAGLFDINMGSVSLVNMLALAYLSHYNGCKYYREFQEHTPRRFLKAAGLVMLMAASSYAIVEWAAFRAFGSAAQPVIFSNFAKGDMAGTIAQVSMGLAIVCSFPLMFSGLREAICSLAEQVGADSARTGFQNKVSVICLAMVLAICTVMTDAGFVCGVVGAICGTLIIYVIPCVLFIKVEMTEAFSSKYRILAASILLPLSVGLLVLGTMSAFGLV